MALQAVREIALHWGGFRNVDLFHQGVYHLRCRIFEETGEGGGAAATAAPHVFLPESGLQDTPAEVLPAAVLESEATFRTKSVLIRYCEEQVKLNDLALFRFERDASRDPTLVLEVQLMYAEASLSRPLRSAGSGSGTESIGADGTPSWPPKLGESDFTSVSTQQLHLHDVLRGVHAFCPLSFDEMHCCRVELMVHTTLLDFRLRIRPEVPLSPYAPLPPQTAPGRGRPATLADVLMELAGELAEAEAAGGSTGSSHCASGAAPARPSAGSDASTAAGLGGTARWGAASACGLAEAADRIQREAVARLAAAREALAVFLSELAASQRSSREGLATLPPLRLPGREATQSQIPVPISSRLGSAGEPTAAVTAARLLAEDLSFVAAQVLQAWQVLLKAVSQISEGGATRLLQGTWRKRLAQHWAESIYSRTCPISSLAAVADEEMAAVHSRAAAALRQSATYQSLLSHVIDDLAAVPPPHEQPVLFEERYAPLQATNNPNGVYTRGDIARPEHCGPSYTGAHVFVLVHGFQGTAFDMRLMKNNIALQYPEAICLCSEKNEDDTEGDIEQMGERLAAEVRTFIQDWCSGEENEPTLGRLSFVTHSVGGLIVRSALPLLAEFHSRMYTFLSFSSPHLGYLYSANSLFRAGLWVAKKLRKSKCLEQLSMTDSPDTGSCFLSRLAELPGLEHFQHVVLISSHQDQYAPFESARLEMPRVAEADPKLGCFYVKMLRNVLDPLKAERIIRIDVDFHIPETNIDTVIGRTAHIQFIESQPLMKMLVQTHSFLFE